MKLLAWDTSSKVGAIVALEWDSDLEPKWSNVRLVTELTLNVESTHSERLLWGIHQVLESARWSLKDVDVFGVGVGPGSFTGLRIGITTARTLAHTLNKPVVGISSLAALARPAVLLYSSISEMADSVWVIAVTDACKGELFALSGNPQSLLHYPGPEGSGEQVIEPAELMSSLLEELSTEPATRWIAVGEGRHRYLDEWNKLPDSKKLRDGAIWQDHVQGRYLGMLAWEAVQAGAFQDALEIQPRYLRASDAELKLKRGQLKPSPTGSPDV